MNLNDYYLIEQGGKDRYQQLLREADEERILKGINAFIPSGSIIEDMIYFRKGYDSVGMEDSQS